MSNSKANMSNLTFDTLIATDVLAIIFTSQTYINNELYNYYVRRSLNPLSRKDFFELIKYIYIIPSQLEKYNKELLTNALSNNNYKYYNDYIKLFKEEYSEKEAAWWENNRRYNNNKIKSQIVEFLIDHYFNKEENKQIPLVKFVIEYFDSTKNNSKQQPVDMMADSSQVLTGNDSKCLSHEFSDEEFSDDEFSDDVNSSSN